jgi:hypothetical protein
MLGHRPVGPQSHRHNRIPSSQQKPDWETILRRHMQRVNPNLPNYTERSKRAWRWAWEEINRRCGTE